MAIISDINDTELWVINVTLRERYGRDVDIQVADSEVRLSLSDRDLTECPLAYWKEEGCHFAIMKTGDQRYRCQFFYRNYQQFGTGVSEYKDLAECVVSLLQAQADHAAKERGDL